MTSAINPKGNSMREIHTREELLASLREDPMRRIVKYVEHEPAVVQYPRMFREYEWRGLRGKLVAAIADDSDAQTLLNEIYSIEGCGVEVLPDEQAAAQLPLRYGPCCSEYCLPEYLKEWGRADSDSDLPEIHSRHELLTCLYVNATRRHIEEIRDKLTIVELRDDDCEVEIVTVASKSDAWRFLHDVEKEYFQWLRAMKNYAWPYALGYGRGFETWRLPEHPDLEEWNSFDEDEDFHAFLKTNPGWPEVSP
jgi:hypothetical protein